MEHIGEFIANHLFLVMLFIGLSILLAVSFAHAAMQGGTVVDINEATRLINKENAVVLDIRGSSDFSKGHILNAVNIPMADFEKRSSELNKYRSQPVIVCCNTGMTAGTAVATLSKMGLEKTNRLKGGLEAWRAASLPVTKK